MNSMFIASFGLKTTIQKLIFTLRDFADYAELHPAREMKRLALAESVELVRKRMPTAQGVESSREVLSIALSQVMPQGHCLEFGVFKGGTIRFIADRLPHRTIHGFDSFQGLPSRWTGDAFNFDAKGQPSIGRPNVQLHAGWFSDTLPPWLANNSGPAAFIHVDSDLYESAKCVLELLEPRIVPGTVIVFDEYFNYPGWTEGEHRAFIELEERAGLTCEYLAYARFQVAVVVTAVGRNKSAVSPLKEALAGKW